MIYWYTNNIVICVTLFWSVYNSKLSIHSLSVETDRQKKSFFNVRNCFRPRKGIEICLFWSILADLIVWRTKKPLEYTVHCTSISRTHRLILDRAFNWPVWKKKFDIFSETMCTFYFYLFIKAACACTWMVFLSYIKYY